MKNFFDVLDRLYESGQPSMSEAISALQGEFPELSALFLFGDFLRDLATNLASRGPK